MKTPRGPQKMGRVVSACLHHLLASSESCSARKRPEPAFMKTHENSIVGVRQQHCGRKTAARRMHGNNTADAGQQHCGRITTALRMHGNNTVDAGQQHSKCRRQSGSPDKRVSNQPHAHAGHCLARLPQSDATRFAGIPHGLSSYAY